MGGGGWGGVEGEGGVGGGWGWGGGWNGEKIGVQGTIVLLFLGRG